MSSSASLSPHLRPLTPAPTLSAFLGRSIDLVDRLLAEQQSLTAVEKFSRRCDEESVPTQERWYRDLLPLHKPGPGEQFAFEVDLDRCSGCKACVTACHSLNGLDEGETWRSVGLLHEPSARIQQHVTTACHHCVEPGCAQGCPTLAYEKDAETGIVTHLDDQCFGCQYCILKCPYDVPQYHADKGIVRKCDMCIGRLRAGEAPACVQACPTQAIRIVLVEMEAIRQAPQKAFDLPGAPDPKNVLPTTRYKSRHGFPEAMSPVNAHQVKPEPAHLPLVFMLTASQTAIGFWIFHALSVVRVFSAPVGNAGNFLHTEIIGLVLVLFSLALGPLHLGRPWLVWKAFLNWRRSWLSREALAFIALGGTSTLAVMAVWFHIGIVPAIVTTAIAALAVLHTSAMVYRDTPRVLWATKLTLWRFTLTALLCGGAAYVAAGGPIALMALLPLLQLSKLALEAQVLRHRNDSNPTPGWKSAQLLLGEMGMVWRLRLAMGWIFGIAFPCLMTLGKTGSPSSGALILPILIWIGITAGELLERTLFFTTAVAPRMPGSR